MITGDKKRTWKKEWTIFEALLWSLFCGISVLGLRLVSWTFNNFGNLRTDELIYTLSADLSGTNPAMVKSGMMYCIPPTLLTVIIALVIYSYVSKKKRHIKKKLVIAGVAVSAAILLSSAGYFAHRIDLVGYIRNQNRYSTFIDDNYVEPDLELLTFPEKKRNLVYIFIESMEISFSDTEHGGGKAQNLIPELTELALETGTFSESREVLNGGYALTGATSTMAGLFAQTTGLPLLPSSVQLHLSESFMPGVIGLGDILEENGYHNVFCIGTDAAFANRDAYFLEHGNYTIYDHNFSLMNGEIPADYSRDFWGYDDSILFANAKKHLLELANEDQPFNFTMLTVDTHAEDGYICELCPDKYEDKYSNVIACSSMQVAEFVRWIQQQDFYENTTIVLAGDHCSMDSNFANDMSADYKKRIYTVFLNPVPELSSSRERYRQYSSMDYFPTTLAALGVKIEGERLGLGTNLFSDKETLVESYGVQMMNSHLSQKSTRMESMMGEQRQMVAFDLSYDDSKGSIRISVRDEIAYSGKYDGLRCTVTHKESTLSKSYDMDKVDGFYTTEIQLMDFYGWQGEYSCDVNLVLPDKLTKWYSRGSVIVERVDYVPPLEFFVSEDSDTLGIVYRQEAEKVYPNIWYAVWSEEEDQDDLAWYAAKKQDEAWVQLIDLSAHTKNGRLAVHIYGGETQVTDCLDIHSISVDQIMQYDSKSLKAVFGGKNRPFQ